MSYAAPCGRATCSLSCAMLVVAPLSIAGLPDCKWKFEFVGSTNIGSAFTEAELKDGMLTVRLAVAQLRNTRKSIPFARPAP